MISIVKAQENHIPEICSLWVEFMRFTAEIEPFFTLSDNSISGFEKEFLRPIFNSGRGLILLAFNGKQPVGYSIAQIQDVPNTKLGKIGYLNHLFIVKEYRHQGIGAKIYNEILTWLRAENISRIELSVLPKNLSAYSFWKKRGFVDYSHSLCCYI